MSALGSPLARHWTTAVGHLAAWGDTIPFPGEWNVLVLLSRTGHRARTMRAVAAGAGRAPAEFGLLIRFYISPVHSDVTLRFVCQGFYLVSEVGDYLSHWGLSHGIAA